MERRRGLQTVNQAPVVHTKVEPESPICSVTLTPASNHPQLCVCECADEDMCDNSAATLPRGFRGRLGGGGGRGRWCGVDWKEERWWPLTPLHFCGLSVTATAATSAGVATHFQLRAASLRAGEGVECRGTRNVRLCSLQNAERW